MEIATLAGLALSTLVSEDLASISAGLLAHDRHLPVAHAVAACIVGIYLGDLGLWAVGRLLQLQALKLPRLRRMLNAKGLAALSPRIDERLAVAILVSRFVPGSRLPMYVAMGIWGRRPLAFAAWSLLAVLVWTPLLVVSTAYLGETLAAHLLTNIKTGVLGSLLTAIAVLGALRLVSRAVARTAQRYHQRFDQTIETPT
jgi:membrane protein DedA with SNARE-associated domain